MTQLDTKNVSDLEFAKKLAYKNLPVVYKKKNIVMVSVCNNTDKGTT